MSLFGHLQNDASFMNAALAADKQILAAGAVPNSTLNSKAINHMNPTSIKHKKSAKKVSNALGSLSSASTAAVNNNNGGHNMNPQHAPLLNGHYAAASSTT